MNTYSRPDFVLTHGDGCYLYDSNGNAYLDFVAGIAVCALGHADKELQSVLCEQAGKLWHCSNLYHFESQVRLGQLLIQNTFADKAFFCNSGTEAMEGAIKFARKWADEAKGNECKEIIAMSGGFHGRTFGALSATGQRRLQQGFEPMLPGFVFADFNNAGSVEKAINDKTCAILVEPIQGEGGIFPADLDFMQTVRQLCDENNLLLILDEIQCGLGRTGTFCAYENYNIIPDVMTLAKPIANGLPLGAVLVTDAVAEAISPGDHGTTFGGGPLVTTVAEHVVSRLIQPEFLAHIQEMGIIFNEKLLDLQKQKVIEQVRGTGLMIGVQLAIEPKKVINECARQGLLICKTGGQAVRFLPPLIVNKQHIEEALQKFQRALDNCRGDE